MYIVIYVKQSRERFVTYYYTGNKFNRLKFFASLVSFFIKSDLKILKKYKLVINKCIPVLKELLTRTKNNTFFSNLYANISQYNNIHLDHSIARSFRGNTENSVINQRRNFYSLLQMTTNMVMIQLTL